MHSLNTKNIKNKFMAVKLDIAKAFDKVEWRFVDAVWWRKWDSARDGEDGSWHVSPRLLILFWSMVNKPELSNPGEDLDKVIQSHLIYISSALKWTFVFLC